MIGRYTHASAKLAAALLATLIGIGAPLHAQQDDDDAAQADAQDEAQTDVADAAGDADATPDANDDDANDDAKDANDAAAQAADAADQPDDAADDNADDADHADAAAAGNAQDDAADDADDQDDDADDGPVEQVVAIQTWDAEPMREDEVWAPVLHTDPAKYNIPVDNELNPTGADWIAVEPNPAAATPAQVTAVVSIPSKPNGKTGGKVVVPKERSSHLANSEDMPIVMLPDPKRPRPVPPPGSKPGAGDRDTSYSTGGQPVRPYGAPWQAQIYFPRYTPQFDADLKKGVLLWQAQHYCGGTLIADNWVLTAAHCIDESMVQAGYRVRLGLTDISKDDGSSYKIERIVRHSQYADASLPLQPNRYKNDIALIRIVADDKTKPRDPEKIKAIPIDDKPVPDGTEVAATGWGKTQPVDQHAPHAVLMRVVLQVMDNDRCRKLPDYGPQRVPDEIICAADQRRSTCRGDSGGALTLATGAPSVVGIVSWGKARCSGDGNPAGYTRVASYAGWIKQAMALDRSKNKLP